MIQFYAWIAIIPISTKRSDLHECCGLLDTIFAIRSYFPCAIIEHRNGVAVHWITVVVHHPVLPTLTGSHLSIVSNRQVFPRTYVLADTFPWKGWGLNLSLLHAKPELLLRSNPSSVEIILLIARSSLSPSLSSLTFHLKTYLFCDAFGILELIWMWILSLTYSHAMRGLLRK